MSGPSSGHSASSSRPMRPAYSLYRLHHDLSQLADEPLAGIHVVTDDSDMYVPQFILYNSAGVQVVAQL